MCIRDREYTKGVENKIPDTLSRVDTERMRTGRDLKEIEIYRLSREDRLFGAELKDVNNMQRAGVKLNKQEITQTKADINDRINIIEEIRTRQLEAVELFE